MKEYYFKFRNIKFSTKRTNNMYCQNKFITNEILY